MRYLYADLAGVMLLGTIVVYVTRRDLRGVIVAVWPLGAAWEWLSEVWYLHDYWHPHYLLPKPFMIEDMVYGGSVTALAACAVAFWASAPWPWARGKLTYGRGDGRGRTAMAAKVVNVFLLFVAAMTLGRLADVPSIWIATLFFLLVGLYCVVMDWVIDVHRVREILTWAVGSGVIMMLLAIVGYGVGLNWFIDGPKYLSQVYLLAGTKYDHRWLGIPIDEIAWNLTRGFGVGALFPYLTGRRLVRVNS